MDATESVIVFAGYALIDRPMDLILNGGPIARRTIGHHRAARFNVKINECTKGIGAIIQDDLKADPGEEDNLFEARGGAAEEHVQLLRGFFKAHVVTPIERMPKR